MNNDTHNTEPKCVRASRLVTTLTVELMLKVCDFFDCSEPSEERLEQYEINSVEWYKQFILDYRDGLADIYKKIDKKSWKTIKNNLVNRLASIAKRIYLSFKDIHGAATEHYLPFKEAIDNIIRDFIETSIRDLEKWQKCDFPRVGKVGV